MSTYRRVKRIETKPHIRPTKSGAKKSLGEIADLLHFDTPNYFCKTFKRYVGVTPRAYRARYRQIP